MVAARENNNTFISGPDLQSGFLWKLIGLGVSLVFVLVVYRILSGDLDRMLPRYLSFVESVSYAPLGTESLGAALEGKVDRQLSGGLNMTSAQAMAQSAFIMTEQSTALPQLSDSDLFVAIEASKLSSGTVMEKVWSTEEVIRKLAHLLANMESGEASLRNFAFLNPQGELRVTSMGEDRYVLDDQNFDRYDFFVQSIEKVDPGAMVQVFTLLRPLLRQAYGELGYDESEFDTAVVVALRQLGEVPQVTAPIELVRPSVIFKFADPAIEELTSVQKQFIRMGPENAAILQDKLSQVARLLLAPST